MQKRNGYEDKNIKKSKKNKKNNIKFIFSVIFFFKYKALKIWQKIKIHFKKQTNKFQKNKIPVNGRRRLK